MANEIKALTPTLKVISDLLSFFQTPAIRIPSTYRDRVLKVKALLEDDVTGLVNSLLDFAIDAACVNYRVESDNENLAEEMNNWLQDLNSPLRGKIPTGIRALAKEYFRERWKGSSNLLLRTYWSNTDGNKSISLPDIMFFVDGEDIKVKTESKVVKLGDEKYYLRVNNNPKDDIPLPGGENEEIFIQKPFESWGNREPVPYIIRRGIYHNAEFLKIISSKGENTINKAIEYLLHMTKGTERMYLEGNVSYSESDLLKANQDLSDILARRKSEGGIPSYTSNFDTKLEHLIPDYTKIISEVLYSPLEKRILAGLGMIEIVDSVAGSSRKESILNPKAFIGEINSGVADFKTLLTDVIKVAIEKNKASHPKWMNARIEVTGSPMKAFMDDKFRTLLRSIYDRGSLSKRTLVEVVGDLDFDVEVERRGIEKREGLEDKLYPPVIQNVEKDPLVTNVDPKKKEKTLPDRQGPEAKNFNSSSIKKCKNCNYEINSEDEETIIDCPGCGATLDLTSASDIIFEEAPYKNNEDLPQSIKVLPSKAQSLWREVFNNSIGKGEDYARKVAWSVVKKSYHKDSNGDWKAN